jgi:hypothetical protein
MFYTCNQFRRSIRTAQSAATYVALRQEDSMTLFAAKKKPRPGYNPGRG